LFQSVRELLFNVVKHAGTNAACIEMLRQDEHTVIMVSDEGKGFDPEGLWTIDCSADKDYGLFNIRERLLLLGGDFEIRSRSGHGTTIRISVPLQTYFDLPEPKDDPAAAEHTSNCRLDEPANRNLSGPIRVMLVDDALGSLNRLGTVCGFGHDIPLY
jgi:hypothetical protein